MKVITKRVVSTGDALHSFVQETNSGFIKFETIINHLFLIKYINHGNPICYFNFLFNIFGPS